MAHRVVIVLLVGVVILSLFFNQGYAEEKWREKLDKNLLSMVEKQPMVMQASSEEKIKVMVWTEDKDLESYGDVNKKFKVIPAVAMDVSASQLKGLAENQKVSKITIDHPVTAFRVNSTPMIRADTAASTYGVNGTGIKIAVIDTGVFNHTEFGTRIIDEKCFCYESGPAGCCPNNDDTDSNATDDNGHGTHVAGIAAGEGGSYGQGVATNASIIAIKVLDSSGLGYTSDIVSGIEWAIDNGADIISMSLGTKYNQFSECYEVASSNATDNATAQGIVIVVAAGNEGAGSNTISAPACAKTAITVGSVSKSDSITSYSSRGATNDNRTKPDLTAPGGVNVVGCTSGNSEIISTSLNNNYACSYGTSQATPHVSGAAALLMEKYNSLYGNMPDPGLVKAVLITAVNTTGMGGGQRNNNYGSGRIDVMEMLRIMNYTYNDTVSSSGENVHGFNVTNTSFKVSLVWMENMTYHNNLDMVVQAPNGTNYSNPSDVNDTVEQLFAGNDTGIWKVYVKGTSVTGSQEYYLGADAEKYDVNSAIALLQGTNVSLVHYGDVWKAYVKWDETIIFSYAEHNQAGTFLNYTAAVASNWTNYTNVTPTGEQLGPVNVSFYANDSNDNWAKSDAVTLYLYGWAEVNESNNPLSVDEDTAAKLNCRVRDSNTTAPIGNYTVHFWDNTTYLGNNSTNSTGWSEFSQVFNTPGGYEIKCNITDNASLYYNASLSSNTTTLTVNDVTSPQYENETHDVNITYGQDFEASINWTDNVALSGVFFESNYSGTMENYSASGSYDFVIGWENHTVGKLILWRWVANDTSGNDNSTSLENYIVQMANTISYLYLNGTQGNTTYSANQIMNITASINVPGLNISINTNFTGNDQLIANGTGSAENFTNTSNLNTSTVYNITAYFDGDENYTGSSVTYFTGVCSSCPSPSGWSACSGGSKSRTSYQCGLSTGYACSAYTESQSCSTGGTTGISYTPPPKNVKVSISESTAEINISSISEGEAENITLEDEFVIDSVSIKVSNDVSKVKILIEEKEENPADEDVGGKVYAYFSIEKENITNDDIESSYINFTVNRSWIEGNSIRPDSISLNKYNNGWTKLTTTKTGEDGYAMYFQAESAGFSFFAINGEEYSCPACPGERETRCIDGEKTRTIWWCNSTSGWECASINTTLACRAEEVVSQVIEEGPALLYVAVAVVLVAAIGVWAILRGKRVFKKLKR
ncbi:MAG: S8 family serine peptidase [Candidatus Aenigmatarchaeota archaeon]